MSDLKALLDATKNIEFILEHHFGGEGRGMTEKLNTVHTPLPESLDKKIRYIARMRNKTMHEHEFEIYDMPKFLRTCTEAIAELEQIALYAKRGKAGRSTTHGTTASTAPAAPVPPSPRPQPKAPVPPTAAQKRILAGILGIAVFGLLAILYVLGSASSSSPATDYADSAELQSEQVANRIEPTPAASPAKAAPSPTEAPKPQRVEKAADASKAAPKPKPPTKVAEDVNDDTPSATQQRETRNVSSGEVIGIRDVKLAYGKGSFGDNVAKITATYTNHTGATVSSLRLRARLFLNGEKSPAAEVTESTWGDSAFVFFGDRGLANGESQTYTITFDRMGSGKWTMPDALNASSRRVEIALLSYSDGMKRDTKKPGNFVSSPEFNNASASKASASNATAPVSRETPVALGKASIQYVRGSFNEMEAKITVTVTNQSGGTISNAWLAARVFINDDNRPALTTPRSGDSHSGLFAYFGANGLAAGESRTISITQGHMADSGWRAPDMINAQSRRIELAVLSYSDGRSKTVNVARGTAAANWN